METLTTPELLTMAEIQARFAPHWVLIGDPETDENSRLLAGKVLFSCETREDVYRKMSETRLERCAVRYLGEWPEDVALVL